MGLPELYHRRESRRDRFQKATRAINTLSDKKEEAKSTVVVVNRKIGNPFG